MIELFIGAMVVSGMVCVAPRVIADAITTMRASKAGAWDVIERDRDRRDKRSADRRERLAKAWASTRAARNRQAGGDGTYRPGASAYLGDVYHGWWEDALEKRTAKRAARSPMGPDGKRPPVSKFDAAVGAKVGTQRTKTGYVGRVARALIDPVGEKRQSSDVVPPQAVRPIPDGSADPFNPPTIPHPNGPRTACPMCGDTLTNRDGDWRHPADSTCESARTGGESSDPEVISSVVHNSDSPTPDRRAQEPDALDRVVEGIAAARARQRPVGMTSCDQCGVEAHIDALTPMSNGSNVQMWCAACRQKTDNTAPTSNGGTDMSTDTVDLVDYNTAVAEHERALEALRAQLDQAIEFGLHLTGATAAVEQMDAGRGAITNGLAPLAEGMEGSRYDGDSTQGSAEAVSSLTAGSIAAVQENIEAAAEQNNRWIAELNESIDGVQASLQHIKSQYGEAAAAVQETGIDGRALEEH